MSQKIFVFIHLGRRRTGFRVKEACTVVAFDRRKLHDFIARSPHMRDAAEAAEIADLWGKHRACMAQGTRNAYKAMRAPRDRPR